MVKNEAMNLIVLAVSYETSVVFKYVLFNLTVNVLAAMYSPIYLTQFCWNWQNSAPLHSNVYQISVCVWSKLVLHSDRTQGDIDIFWRKTNV